MSDKLEKELEARKLRLDALRRRKAGENVGDGASILISRNFDPASRTVKKRTQADNIEDTIEKNVEGMAAMIIAEDEQRRAQELDIFNIAPKRPNWDLKRGTMKKLARLERKTQEGVHTLIRQRLSAQKGESDDLVGAMQAQERADRGRDSDDDE